MDHQIPRLFIDLLLRFPRSVGLLAVILFLSSLFVIFEGPEFRFGVRVDPSIRSLLPTTGDEIEFLEEVQNRYSSDDLLLVTWIDENLFSPSNLASFKKLTRRIEEMPGVEDVESLATAIRTKVYEDYTEVNPYLAELPETVEQSLEIRAAISLNPLYKGYLVSEDGKGAMISVRFNRDLNAQQLIKKVSLIKAYSAEAANGVENFLSGPLFVRLEISRLLLEDLYRVMPLAVLVSLLVLALGFRTARGVVLPFLSNTVALVMTFAVFVSNGNLLNYVTVILPPTIYVVGFAYSVHVMSDFERNVNMQTSLLEAVRKALRDVVVPVTLTAMTTAIGFFSLTFSSIESINTFGLYACIGTVAAWLSALTVVPAGLIIFASVKKDKKSDGITTFSLILGKQAKSKGRAIILMGVLLGAASVLGIQQIGVGTNYLANFSQESQTRQDFDRMSHVFAGAVPLQIVLSCPEVDCFKRPEVLREMSNLKSWLSEQPEIGGVYTLLDYIGTLEEALAPERVDVDPIPESSGLISHYLLLGASEDVRRFADPSYTSSLMQVRLRVVASSDINRLSDRIEIQMEDLGAGLDARITGSSYLIARTLDDVTLGQVLSLAAAAIPIYLVLVLMFRSIWLAFVALIPNILPILAFFGVLGWSGISLNLTTSLVASVVLGIAVDDSIHFFARLRQMVRSGEADALDGAIAAVIRPVTFTTVGLSLGFLTLISGQLLSQAEFGVLVALTLIIAWILDLTFTPALAHWSGLDSQNKSNFLSIYF